jgi:hypothetical protein
MHLLLFYKISGLNSTLFFENTVFEDEISFNQLKAFQWVIVFFTYPFNWLYAKFVRKLLK